MVLDKLSSSLKDTFKKIAGLGTVDKEAVDRIVLDLQRALLQADVDVSLVSELSKKIKEKILKDKPPAGLTLKEFFIKTLYDELVNFLGSEKGELEIKSQRILMVGLFGSGKCVHPKSNIVLGDGNVVSAERLYINYLNSGEKNVGDGTIIDITDKNLLVPSFNPQTLKIENKKATHLWKLRGKDLFEVFLDNGNDFSVRVTPEHPFFVLRQGILKQVRADELNEDDFVAVPRSYPCKGQTTDLFPYLRKLDLSVYLDPKKAKEFLPRYGTLKEACNSLELKRNYCTFTSLVKTGVVPIELLEEIGDPIIKIRQKMSPKPIHFPRYLSPELAEFLGYVIGDGHLDRGTIQIFNEDPEITERIKELSAMLFGIVSKARFDERTEKMYRISIISVTLVNILNKVFGIPIGKKGKELKIPGQLMTSPDDVIRSFLKAYFDCDGSLLEGTRQIEIISESRPLISETSSLLLRFGIVSTISKKIVNNVPYWRLSIRSRYAETYADKIGFRIERKQMRADVYKKIGIIQGCGKQDMIPVSNILKDVRQAFGFSVGYIQEYVNSYGQYERYGLISRESLEKVTKIYNTSNKAYMTDILSNVEDRNHLRKYSTPLLNSVISYFKKEGLVSTENALTSKGSVLLEQIKAYPKYEVLQFIKLLADSDVCWTRVNKVSPYENKEEYVYDLTVEDNHSFIADNIIVHNTTTSGKLAKWLKTRGLSVGFVACDVHRPAAKEQLKQLAKQLEIKAYTEGKKAEDVAKEALKQSKEDVLIFDTAGRNALDEELAEELRSLGKLVKADEVLLVIPADLGQAAKKQASEFVKLVGITGIVVTKLDGTAKGGGALSAASVTGAKVKFIGVGEKMEALEEYDPQRFVSKMIGYGDIQGLLEKAKDVGLDEKKAQKIASGEFTLEDFIEQIKGMQKMGPLSSLTSMIPGLSGAKIPKDLLDVQESKMKKWKNMIDSMTPEERQNPELIKQSRAIRIAKGSGTKPEDVKGLIKNYEKIKKMMKMVGGEKGLKRGQFAQIAKQMGLKL